MESGINHQKPSNGTFSGGEDHLDQKPCSGTLSDGDYHKPSTKMPSSDEGGHEEKAPNILKIWKGKLKKGGKENKGKPAMVGLRDMVSYIEKNVY